jgi:hypothetical protein
MMRFISCIFHLILSEGGEGGGQGRDGHETGEDKIIGQRNPMQGISIISSAVNVTEAFSVVFLALTGLLSCLSRNVWLL